MSSLKSAGRMMNVFIVTGTSWYASIFLVVNAALGAGLLNFPDAYHQAGGVVIALAVQAVSNRLDIKAASFHSEFT